MYIIMITGVYGQLAADTPKHRGYNVFSAAAPLKKRSGKNNKIKKFEQKKLNSARLWAERVCI